MRAMVPDEKMKNNEREHCCELFDKCREDCIPRLHWYDQQLDYPIAPFCPMSPHGCTEVPSCPWPCKKLG